MNKKDKNITEDLVVTEKQTDIVKEVRKQMSPILGMHLKHLRLKHKLTLAEVANRSKLTSQVISYYERALRIPTVESLEKLAAVYDENINHLISLREATVLETVTILGDEAPASLRTERNMIAHARDKNDYSTKEYELVTDIREVPSNIFVDKSKDSIDLGDGEFATQDEIEEAKAFILALRQLKKK
ncbi:helix-turn-helix domain-containing protein [Lysinibacillus sp. NPDC059133]|uniref:helix-turn-helix domain-containing protein n=1 Tax=Lysinibacillus sp. NPDC059133 TaxID=3346737 RepID=UPI0036BB4941